ncbi:hypothetical protein XENTR_v10002333 [Xenopus tropicalis]|nr:hypothetical protein XENTR_v10002333 [Xenopus tropicalis]
MDYKEEADSRDPFGEIRKPHQGRSPHRYSKEELLDIKELPHSKERPSCLLDKYDSDGVWDPEKWHSSLYPNSGRSSPVEALKKDSDTERTSLKRRIADPRERVKEDDLDVVLSPQRRSFGGGCHVIAAASSRRSGSPLDNKENESMRMLGSRRIGSGRIMTARGFDRDVRGDREPREGRDREKEYKDKRFRREHGDSKRVFGERRRNDSCTEEEPEWFSGGPTSQSETIELTGFDDKILEEDHKGRKRTRKRTGKEGFPSGASQFLGEQFPTGLPKEEGPMMAQVSPLEMQQAALDGFIPTDIALQAANYYHPGYGKMQMDKSREHFRSRPQPRVNKSPVANMRGASLSPGPGASVTSMLSPSFTPTSVIRKMYESKEKSKDETVTKQNVGGKEEGHRTLEDGSMPNSITHDSPQETSPVMGNKVSTSQRSSCTPPLPHQNRYTKDQDYRPKSTGRRTPTVASPVPGASFLQPLHQLPIVPVVRPSHQLHPGLVQRMLAQGVPPQHLSLLQAGLLPPGVDLPPIHALSQSVLGQPFYPLSPAGHPLLNQRPANPLQLAMMQQSMQRPGSGLHAPPQGMTNRPNMHIEQRPSQRSTSPVGLAKWFGSDVLQQPLPSMPAKVISVDELEYRQ